MPSLSSPFTQPCKKLRTLKWNHISRAPALVGLIFCLSCTIIPKNIKSASVCEAIWQFSYNKSVNDNNRVTRFRRFSDHKATNKPNWNDGLPNSAKKRKHHRRRGLFLRESRTIWGLGFELSRLCSRQRLRGMFGAMERRARERVFQKESHGEDKEEMGRSSLWGHRIDQSLLRNSSSYYSSYTNCKFKFDEQFYEYLMAGDKKSSLEQSSIEQSSQLRFLEQTDSMPTLVEEAIKSGAKMNKGIESMNFECVYDKIVGGFCMTKFAYKYDAMFHSVCFVCRNQMTLGNEWLYFQYDKLISAIMKLSKESMNTYIVALEVFFYKSFCILANNVRDIKQVFSPWIIPMMHVNDWQFRIANNVMLCCKPIMLTRDMETMIKIAIKIPRVLNVIENHGYALRMLVYNLTRKNYMSYKTYLMENVVLTPILCVIIDQTNVYWNKNRVGYLLESRTSIASRATKMSKYFNTKLLHDKTNWLIFNFEPRRNYTSFMLHNCVKVDYDPLWHHFCRIKNRRNGGF